MRFAVCLSRLPDPDTVEVDPLTGDIDVSRILHILNPADAVALELVLRLRSPGDRVMALTVGPIEAETVLREALAVGADEVLRVWEDGRTTTRPAVTALLLATALRMQELPDLIVCGARTVAGGSGKVPALIAEHLDWPVVPDINRIPSSAVASPFPAPTGERRTIGGQGDAAGCPRCRFKRSVAALCQSAGPDEGQADNHSGLPTCGSRALAGRPEFPIRHGSGGHAAVSSPARGLHPRQLSVAA